MSNITKNWFYKLSDFSEENITIEKNIVAVFFDDWNQIKNIELWENSIVEIYWYLNKEEDFNINIYQNEENSKLRLRYLLNSNNNKLKSKIFSKISSNNSISDVKIISIVWENWFVDIDWIIEIDKGVKWVKWHLIEENLFLWSTWKVKWIPTLLVGSDDVEASHSCKMERISDEKLFYLRSRWIGKENAVNMMIEAYIKDLFWCLELVDNDFYHKLTEEILLKIK